MQVMKGNNELNKKKNEKAPKLINKVKNIKTAVKRVAGFNPDTQYWERVQEITLGDGVVSKVVYKYPSMNDKLKCSNTYVLESYINGNKQTEISYVDGEIIYKKEYYPNGKLEVEYVCFGENEKLKEASLTSFYDNGKMKNQRIDYRNGQISYTVKKLDGSWSTQFVDATGKELSMTINYADGSVKNIKNSSDGKLRKEFTTYPEGISTKNVYYSNGVLKEETIYDNNGKVRLFRKYEFGKMVLKIEYAVVGNKIKQTSKIERKYDLMGKILWSKTYGENDNIKNWTMYFSNDDKYEKKCCIKDYYKNGNIKRETMYYLDGHTKSVVSYDINGKEIDRIEYEPRNTFTTKKQNHKDSEIER